jgi:hypothetical protein
VTYIALKCSIYNFPELEDLIQKSASENELLRVWLNEVKQERRKVEDVMRNQNRSQKLVKKNNGPPLLWACDTEFGWINLGPHHFPQFLRTATCVSRRCFNEFYHCIPKKYTVKVLKRLGRDENPDHTSVQLPLNLRETMKFVNVTTNICCECSYGLE